MLNRYLEYGQIEGFLKEEDTAFFCKQDTNISRPDKSLRNGPTELVKDIFIEDKKRSTQLYVKICKDGRTLISALNAAIIARTYMDLKKEKIKVNIKNNNEWDREVNFIGALRSSSGVGNTYKAADLAYRLFWVAFQSEMLNVNKGHGYWPVFFKPIYLRNYILVQKCINCAFSGRNPNEWRDRLQYLVINLPVHEKNEL